MTALSTKLDSVSLVYQKRSLRIDALQARLECAKAQIAQLTWRPQYLDAS
jgi:hypothetical protein